jgi:hypothetical protein
VKCGTCGKSLEYRRIGRPRKFCGSGRYAVAHNRRRRRAARYVYAPELGVRSQTRIRGRSRRCDDVHSSVRDFLLGGRGAKPTPGEVCRRAATPADRGPATCEWHVGSCAIIGLTLPAGRELVALRVRAHRL